VKFLSNLMTGFGSVILAIAGVAVILFAAVAVGPIMFLIGAAIGTVILVCVVAQGIYQSCKK
jgi:hypothetical protein